MSRRQLRMLSSTLRSSSLSYRNVWRYANGYLSNGKSASLSNYPGFSLFRNYPCVCQTVLRSSVVLLSAVLVNGYWLRANWKNLFLQRQKQRFRFPFNVSPLYYRLFDFSLTFDFFISAEIKITLSSIYRTHRQCKISGNREWSCSC